VTDRVLGIDPGLSETGWAVLDASPSGPPELVASGCIRTPASDLLPVRLKVIHRGITAVLEEHRPRRVALEEMFFLKAAHTVRATLQARGVILLAAAQKDLPLTEFNPRQVKTALTGSGAAAKSQMQRMVKAALGLDKPLRPHDVADAAAIALCQLRARGIRKLKVLERIGKGRAA